MYARSTFKVDGFVKSKNFAFCSLQQRSRFETLNLEFCVQ
jgi:hypothetical protein